MFCQNCGAKLQDGAVRFCPDCGAAVAQGTASKSQPSDAERQESKTTPVGFSSKINDPSFAAYRKKSSQWAFLFSGILAVIASISFPIYGRISGDIDWPNSLFYGIGIGTMFLFIAFVQTMKSRLDKTWDGVVTYKNMYEEIYRGGKHTSRRTVYIIKVQKDSGGIKKLKWRDAPGPYGYYNVGDRVRHHRGFYYFEKYDKSHDSIIMCAACLTMCDIDKDVCPRCKCPLLK